jgi:hypothetical protein
VIVEEECRQSISHNGVLFFREYNGSVQIERSLTEAEKKNIAFSSPLTHRIELTKEQAEALKEIMEYL